MRVNSFFNIERHFSIDCSYSEEEFKSLFIQKFVEKKKTKFKGKIEKDTLKLWRDRDIIKVPAFTILEIGIEKSDKSNLLNGKVKLTKYTIISLLLALIIVLFVFISAIIENGVQLENVIPTLGIIAGGMLVTHVELYNDKHNYLSELKQLFAKSEFSKKNNNG